MQATALLESALPRMSDADLLPFRALTRVEIKSMRSRQGFATLGTGRVSLSDEALRKHGLGGVTWLLGHECYHLHDMRGKSEGNANAFAHRIRRLIEMEPPLYRWGQRGG